MIENKIPVIIGGASITNDSAWPTWATWVQRRYALKNVINVSAKGMGNEAILIKAAHAALQQKTDNVTVIIQLTNVDKWDWYIQDQNLIQEINNEKHPILSVNNTDEHGFWSTGSHFPMLKEYYKKNYFSIEYHTFRTLQLIQWFVLLSKLQGWNTVILFDSPILSVTEDQLNTGILLPEQCYDDVLVTNTLSQIIYETLDLTDVYKPGLIGYACLNDHHWYSKKFKNHPGSLTHYYYVKEIVSKELDKIFKPMIPFEDFFHEAKKYQELIDIETAS